MREASIYPPGEFITLAVMERMERGDVTHDGAAVQRAVERGWLKPKPFEKLSLAGFVLTRTGRRELDLWKKLELNPPTTKEPS